MASVLFLSLAVLSGSASAMDRHLLQPADTPAGVGAGAGGGDSAAVGEAMKADVPCGNGAGKIRSWTWRLTGPYAPAEMEITSGVDIGVYEAGDLTADKLSLFMEYRPIQNGELMCTTGMDATGGTVWLGGQVFMHNGEECLPTPVKEDGSACCQLIFWHPDGTGNYQTECSGTVDLKADGLFWFETVIPGNECTSSWGGDCGEHMHYALHCDMCANDPKYAGLLDYTTSPQYIQPNKYYIKEVSKEEPYAAADIHVGRQVTTPMGEGWQYTMVFGTSDRDETREGAPPVAAGGLALGA